MHNAHFKHAAQQDNVSYRSWPVSLDPDSVFCFLYQRTVANDNTIAFDGHHFQIPPGPNRRSYTHARVEVRLHLQGYLSVHYQNQQIASFLPLDDRPVRVDHFMPAILPPPVAVSLQVQTEVTEIPSRPKYKPALDHPWRRIRINQSGG